MLLGPIDPCKILVALDYFSTVLFILSEVVAVGLSVILRYVCVVYVKFSIVNDIAVFLYFQCLRAPPNAFM